MRLVSLRPAALAALAMLLAGCLVSEKPLFDATTAVTPIAAGRHEKQQMEEGRWSNVKLGTLKLEGRLYQWKVDDEEEVSRFSLYSVGKDSFVVHSVKEESGKPSNYYALIQQTPEGFVIYQPSCAELVKVRMPARLRPKVVKENSFFTDRVILTEVLTFYANVMEPELRFVQAKR